MLVSDSPERPPRCLRSPSRPDIPVVTVSFQRPGLPSVRGRLGGCLKTGRKAVVGCWKGGYKTVGERLGLGAVPADHHPREGVAVHRRGHPVPPPPPSGAGLPAGSPMCLAFPQLTQDEEVTMEEEQRQVWRRQQEELRQQEDEELHQQMDASHHLSPSGRTLGLLHSPDLKALQTRYNPQVCAECPCSPRNRGWHTIYAYARARTRAGRRTHAHVRARARKGIRRRRHQEAKAGGCTTTTSNLLDKCGGLHGIVGNARVE